jgi:hypothetical protein
VDNGPEAAIVMAEVGVPFGGRDMETAPLGGTETAFFGLPEGLPARAPSASAAAGLWEVLPP